jgi:membrane-bound ClpP family serine protease
MDVILSLWILLLVAGFLLLMLDLLVLPGTHVIGIAGVTALVYGIVRIFAGYGSTAGWIALISVLAVCAILIVWVIKTKSWKKAVLDDKLEAKVNVIDEQKVKIGDEGKAVSRLVPVGQATFAGDIFEVHSIDGFTDQKTPIKVVKIENNKIFVTAI